MNDFVAIGVIKKTKKVKENIGKFIIELDNSNPEYKEEVLFTTFKNDVFEFAEKYCESGDPVDVHYNLRASKFKDGTSNNPTCKAWKIVKREGGDHLKSDGYETTNQPVIDDGDDLPF